MSANLPQFDVLLGGSEDLPQDLPIMKYASARAQEIVSLTEALQEPRKTGLVFQRLPRHMRRRVMSHNAKRLPRQLREAHIRQMEKSGLPPKPKRPSRKYRRRPSNLLEAYNRRQREFIWLETHIWHAKRFHMTSKWGYKLANFPNDKSTRACYRGAANHCLIQDLSYYACIELKGRFDSIVNGLKMLTRDECGLTFGAKAWQKGNREGSITLFNRDSQYPYGAIGRVLFLWKPASDSMNENGSLTKGKLEMEDSENAKKRTIWLWLHPSYYEEVKEELVKVFDMDLCPPVLSERSDLYPPHKRAKLDGFESSPKCGSLLQPLASETPKNEEGEEICQFYSGGTVRMALLKDTLVRFRLTGPLSQAVLRETFLLAPSKDSKNVDFSWWTNWEDVFKCQREIWEGMAGITSPAMFSPHAVIGLTIVDPRCNLPAKKVKAVDLDNACRSDIVHGSIPLKASASPIWNSVIRDYVTKTKPTDAEVNRKQSGNLVPGILECEESEKSKSKDGIGTCVRVPLILIQRPGNQDSSTKRLGYCAGWDLIAPAGWGKSLWLALVLRGARACGLREADMVEDIGFSQKSCWPPLPDTNAAEAEVKQREREAREKYFRLPTNKRPNYTKLGISSPFSCPWNILCCEWSHSSSTQGNDGFWNAFYVLRDLQKLRQISQVLCEIRKGRGSQRKPAHGRREGNSLEERRKKSMALDGWLSRLPSISEYGGDHCLVPIRVTVCKKGTVKDFAVICLPLKEDFADCKSKQSTELKGPMEPVNLDSKQEERKKLRREHKQNLAKLRRKRILQCREFEEGGDELDAQMNWIPRRPAMGPEATAEICKDHKMKMEEMFLPPVVKARKSCSREVVGYVTRGIFSFSDAKEIGISYIPFPALLSLFKTNTWNPELLVFVRNTHCKHYVSAKIEIITE